MTTRKIRDAQMLLGMLEGGELNEEFSALITKSLEELGGMSADSPKSTFKGEVSLKLSLTVANGMVTIGAAIANKLPKRPRRNSIYWVLDDGALSTEHPQQHDMFAGPRDMAGRAG